MSLERRGEVRSALPRAPPAIASAVLERTVGGWATGDRFRGNCIRLSDLHPRRPRSQSRQAEPLL
eukprot:7227641-Pyramimonas_sp.AAC.1